MSDHACPDHEKIVTRSADFCRYTGMTELDPTTMRVFPEPSQDTLIAFIYHTNRIERIPMNKRDIEDAIAQREPNPYVEGHLRAITLVQQLAPDPKLLPERVNTIFEFDEKFPWLKRLHRNLMRPVAEFGVMTLDPSIIHPTDVGSYRQTAKSIRTERDNMIIDVEMPGPLTIREHLRDWANDLCSFHNDMRRTIEYGRYSDSDTEALVDKAYEANLKLSCIKPFTDGSNRTGRLVENLLRLNWGLPWKIISLDDKDQLLDDLRNMQSRF